MLIQLGTVVGGVAIGSELDGGEAAAAGMLAGLTATAFGNGYSRNHEDQADRVGMRYAHEGGYDVSKGPQLWQKFGAKYGEQDAATNTIFGSHSRSSKRAKDLEREIAINYPESP
jgi:predicted Zn-dependent protease